MEVDRILKELKMDRWYKPLLALSFIIILLSLFLPLQWKPLTNLQIGLLFLGIFLFCIGEWLNDVKEVEIMPQTFTTPPMKVTSVFRRQTLFGSVFNFLGIILIIYFLLIIFKIV